MDCSAPEFTASQPEVPDESERKQVFFGPIQQYPEEHGAPSPRSLCPPSSTGHGGTLVRATGTLSLRTAVDPHWPTSALLTHCVYSSHSNGIIIKTSVDSMLHRKFQETISIGEPIRPTTRYPI
ncbi:40S ribosomal protein SA [Manis javanica]|nr:40S ribosomal protein SA [Manis javanica]